MGVEPTERDVEALADKVEGWVYQEFTSYIGKRQGLVALLADALAQARREGAAEVSAKVEAALAELYDTSRTDALRASRAMIALGERGPELLAALERDRAAALRGDA